MFLHCLISKRPYIYIKEEYLEQVLLVRLLVVERVKEIGDKRSLGGRKRDVSNLFTAETFIIGLVSGVICMHTATSLRYRAASMFLFTARNSQFGRVVLSYALQREVI